MKRFFKTVAVFASINVGIVGSLAYFSNKDEASLFKSLYYQEKNKNTEKFKMMEGTYWSTSKAGTVLPIKTMFLLDVEAGSVKYLNEGQWYHVTGF
jgi:hypothetical protein